ncbi:SDR family oxidoreductase [Sporobolomyces salmoneus]|uniref:SDR family oxidoreductase n=1 Tax=Sporobolomyces salmoneus TaxID=183962 RepID=UPI00316FD27D
MPSTYLITGSSRSLGLGYTRELLEAGHRVVAAVRNPDKAEQLDSLKQRHGDKLYLVKCDVTDVQSTKDAAETLEKSGFLSEGGLDAVLANAGVLGGGWNKSSEFSEEDLSYNLKTNLYGVINTVNAFLPLLKKGQGKQIFVTSSVLGSIGGPYGGMPAASAYAISKAAVNMYTVKLATELADEGFTVVPFHPGYVKTDMNSDGGGELEPEEACRLATKNVFLAATKKDNGRFMVYDGSEMPW